MPKGEAWLEDSRRRQPAATLTGRSSDPLPFAGSAARRAELRRRGPRRRLVFATTIANPGEIGQFGPRPTISGTLIQPSRGHPDPPPATASSTPRPPGCRTELRLVPGLGDGSLSKQLVTVCRQAQTLQVLGHRNPRPPSRPRACRRRDHPRPQNRRVVSTRQDRSAQTREGCWLLHTSSPLCRPEEKDECRGRPTEGSPARGGRSPRARQAI